MADFLAQMAQASRERLRQARVRMGESALREQALAQPAPVPLKRDPGGFDIIAELKLVSPAAGRLGEADQDLAGRALAYARAGACAVSVLTEPSRFGGDMAHLRQAAAALAGTAVPAMRKDFLVDPYQVLEARAAGAGGVLVILRMLPPDTCLALARCAVELGMFVLLEAFDEDELQQAGPMRAALPRDAQVLLGLNCRDLRTLQVDPQRFAAALSAFPPGMARVAESGVADPRQAARVRQLGYDMALVGTALMRHADPASALRAMLAAARGPEGKTA